MESWMKSWNYTKKSYILVYIKYVVIKKIKCVVLKKWKKSITYTTPDSQMFNSVCIYFH